MLDRTDAALIVIDLQDKLLPRDSEAAKALLDQAVKLIRVAKTLEVPVLVTEQNPEKLGPTNARVAEALEDTPRLGKLEFGCTENPEFRKRLEAAGRKQTILIGVEAHVCVLQTALQAMAQGFAPYVVRDAIASLQPAEYAAGIDRMQRAGVEVVTTQMAIFEMLRAAGTPEFRAVLPLLK